VKAGVIRSALVLLCCLLPAGLMVAGLPLTAPPPEAGPTTPPPAQADADGSIAAPSGREVPPEVRAEQEMRRRHEEEIQKARDELAGRPSDPAPLEKLVDVLMVEHRGREAREAAEKFVAANPSLPRGFACLGRALYWLGEFDLALLQFQRASSIDPKDATCLIWLGRTHASLGNNEGAMEVLQRALTLDGDDIRALSAIAALEEEAKNYAAASKTWERVALLIEAKKPSQGVMQFVRHRLLQDLAKKGMSVEGLPPAGLTVPLRTFQKVPALKVLLNGRAERYLMIDLSAQETVLTAEASHDLELPEYGGPSYREADGPGTGVEAMAILDTIKVGPLLIHRAPVSVNPWLKYPTPEIAGIIGRRLLSEFLLTIDYPGKVITLAPRPAKPVEGEPLFTNRALLVEARYKGRSAGKWVVDTSTYTPAPVSILWAQDTLGLRIGSPGVRPLLHKSYIYSFTMPEIEIAGVTWAKYRATGVDFRSLSEQIQMEVMGVLSNSLLADTKATFDLAHRRMRLERTQAQGYRSPGKQPQPEPQQGNPQEKPRPAQGDEGAGPGTGSGGR